MLGKPKTGKTTFCKLLAKKIDVVHIEIEMEIEALLVKIKEYDEAPESNVLA